MNKNMQKVFGMVFGLFLFTGLFVLQKSTWNNWYARAITALETHQGYIADAESLRPMIFGFDHFVADLYWLKAINYTGNNAATSGFLALPKYLDIVTDLDPHFVEAYSIGGYLLPLIDTERGYASELMEKGIRNNPDLADLYQQLAFYLFFYEDDSERALYWYQRCVDEVATCSPIARNMIAHLKARAGKYQMALQNWLEKLQNIEDLPERQQNLVLRKIEETTKLIALSCAAESLLATGKTINSIDDLDGVLIDCDRIPFGIRQDFGDRYGLDTVNTDTLRNPFSTNPFVWDAKQKRVRTKQW